MGNDFNQHFQASTETLILTPMLEVVHPSRYDSEECSNQNFISYEKKEYKYAIISKYEVIVILISIADADSGIIELSKI